MRKNYISCIVVFLLMCGCSSIAQNKLEVTTLRVMKSVPYDTFKVEMRFPYINTGNVQIDNLINSDLRKRFFKAKDVSLPFEKFILEEDNIGFTELDYEVTYTDQRIISLKIDAEWCAAYCTNWSDYFNYDYRTGELLIIDKIVDTSGDFRDIVFNHFYEQYETRLYEVKMQLTENDTLDVAEYEHIIENYYKPCLESFDFGKFVLHNNGLHIFYECYVPHVTGKCNRLQC